VQIFFGLTVTHWFRHSFIWLAPFSVGCSCQKGCRTVDRWPPDGLQLLPGSTSVVFTECEIATRGRFYALLLRLCDLRDLWGNFSFQGEISAD